MSAIIVLKNEIPFLEQVYDDIRHLCFYILRWLYGIYERNYAERACLHSLERYYLVGLIFYFF